MKQIFSCLLFLAAFCPAAAAQVDWQPTNGPEGGGQWFIFGNSQYAFYPDDYNFFRTADGLTWERLPYGSVFPIAINEEKIVALQHDDGTNALVVSYDNGSTWTNGTMPPLTRFGFGAAVCSQGIYYLDIIDYPDGLNNRLFRSQDDGLTWDTIATPGPLCENVYSFEDRLYLQQENKYWRLAMSGVDWELISPILNEPPQCLFVSGATRIIATTNNLWSSSNSGVSWKKRYVPYNNYANDNFAAVGNRIYWIAGSTGLMYTDNQGDTWQEVPDSTHYGLRAIDVVGLGDKLLCAIPAKGVAYLNETTNALVPVNEGLTSASVYGLQASSTDLWAACGTGVFAYDLATQQWVDKAPLPMPRYRYQQVAVSPSGKIATFEKYNYSIYLSEDNGSSWDTIHPVDTNNPWSWISIDQIKWLGDVLLIYDESNYKGWRSADLGQSWQAVNMPYQIVYFNGKYYGIGNWGQSLVSSIDAGLTWQIIQGPDRAIFGGLFSSGDRLFVMGADQPVVNTALYSSTDGVNWQYANDGLPVFFQYPTASANEIQANHIWNYQSKYYLHDRTVGLFTSLDTCKTWLPVSHDWYGSLELVDTTFFAAAGTYGGGVLKSALPQSYGSISSGIVFKDDNENGVQEAGEIALAGVQVNITEPNAWFPFWFSTTGTAGNYGIRSLPHGGDTLRAKVLSNYVEKITPPLYIVNNSSNDRNFGVHFIADVTDLSASGMYAGRPRPGFELPTFLNYQNDGTLPANATISVKLDPNYQYTSATPAPAAVFGDSLVWNVAQLPLFAQDRIRIRGTLNQTVPLGTLIKTKGYIAADVADFIPANNQFVVSDMVVGAYDPNEKRVEPAAGLTPAEIAAGKELFYTIQFQNTGTYEAERVRITDHLDTALNFRTLRLVASSHNVTGFQLLPGGLLEVVFDHIALPDSNANEAASHGFVTFAIQRNKAYINSPANKIDNKAAIYFDFNEPIITNTVSSGLLLTPVGTNDPSAQIAKNENLLIVPNPNNGHFMVTIQPTLIGPGQLTIFNITGEVCFQQSLKDLSQPIVVNAPLLITGIYFVQVSGKAGVLMGKVLIFD